MATTVYVPVEEYLSTVYEPDCDYVNGELQERNLGEEAHGLVQKVIAAIFFNNRKPWGFRSITEQRVQVSPTHYRIPDVCVVPSSQPIARIHRKPPFLCVEVLSPEDRFQRVLEKINEYRKMGVPYIWIIDPETREIWTVERNGGPVPLVGDELMLPGTPVRIQVSDLFDEIDEAPSGEDGNLSC